LGCHFGAGSATPILQVSGGSQQVHADPLVFKIGILEKQITFGGLHSGIGQFVQGPRLCVDPGLGRFKADSAS